MGTYFHGNTSEVQPSAEGLQLQTLYLMNPNYVPYSHNSPQHQQPTHSMLTTTHHPVHALNLANFSHAPPNHHQQVGVTIPASNILGSSTADTPTQRYEASGFHGFAAAAANATPRVHYNLWGSVADQTEAATTSNGSECAVTVAATSFPPHIGFHRPMHQRGLQLSLSSQQAPYRSISGEVDTDQTVSPVSRGGGESSMHSVVLGSKYLKAAQELMDEVVNVGKGISKRESVEGANNNKEKRKANIESSSGFGDGSSGGGGGGENGGFKQGAAELSTTQRQELQMKKSKLVSMLDEVELRYRQYHNQMQMVISSFEQAAGFGAAKSYTALAFKTISKQFRSLKDAISLQIRTTSKTLGEDDCFGAKVEGSRLRYVDHHLRQQRALQQLGMIQHNAWRPQRGLPERAVSILRAWLFEHFLHPYPKDSDKVMLARQTGLTRSQVSNWFINARVRLWKPMVEEMYTEEIKEQEQNNGSQDNTNRSKESNKELWLSSEAANATQEQSATKLDHINILQSKVESFNNQNTSPTEISNSNNSLSTSPMGGGSFQSHSAFHLAGSSDIQRSPKNSPGSILSMDMEMKPVETNRESNTKFDGGGYGVFSMEDIGRFNNVNEQLAPRFHGNGVSLTLGLPHNENLPLSTTQHGFLSQNIRLGGRQLEMGNNENEFCAINTTPPSSHSGNNSYESIDIQNRKRFAAQLLRNFVA